MQYHAFAQVSKGAGRIFDDPMIIDSSSIMLIPYRYEAELFASNKAMTWGNYFANIIVYDFKNDSYKKIFPQDTYILMPQTNYYARPANVRPNYPYVTQKWIFYLVRNSDYNQNGKIDEKDPMVLFVSDRQGTGLRPVTPEHESIINLTLFESPGFALLKVQRDKNKDREFKSEDNNHYLIRLDLSDLHLGNPIEFEN